MTYYGEQPAQGYSNQIQSMKHLEGAKHAQTSVILGVVGLFFFGLVFGPLAISQANKAEALFVAATGGKVLGWIATITSALWAVFWVLMFAGGMASSTGS
jgi:uncharacterized Tic20 family protein